MYSLLRVVVKLNEKSSMGQNHIKVVRYYIEADDDMDEFIELVKDASGGNEMRYHRGYIEVVCVTRIEP